MPSPSTCFLSSSCRSGRSWLPTGPAPHTPTRWPSSPPQLLASMVYWTGSWTSPCPPARAPSPPSWWCLDVAVCHQPSSRLGWPLATSSRPPSPWPWWEQGTRRLRPSGSPPPSSCSPSPWPGWRQWQHSALLADLGKVISHLWRRIQDLWLPRCSWSPHRWRPECPRPLKIYMKHLFHTNNERVLDTFLPDD